MPILLRFLKEFRIPLKRESGEFRLSLIVFNSLESDMHYLQQLECSFFPNRDNFFPRSKTLNSAFLAQLLFLVSVSERNVLWEVFNTSETEQEEGGILTSAAECVACIRSAKASQTKTVLFV